MEELNAIVKDLTAAKEEYAALAQAWGAVTVEKKKNDEEFANLARALKGAKMGAYVPVEDGAHPYATVYAFTPSRGYVSDALPLFQYADNPPTDEARRARYIKPAPWLRGVVLFGAEEVRAAVADRARECRARVEEYAAAIAAAPAVYTHYTAALNAAEKVLESEAGKGSPLYYALKRI